LEPERKERINREKKQGKKEKGPGIK
jgi:hypothetical protein